jgi:hypothetical protein
MAATDEVVFGWAIAKCVLIVIVALVILVYAAWAGTEIMLSSSGKQKLH